MSRFREAIYVVVPCESFRPCSPWNWPEGFVSGELLRKNISRNDAKGFARAFNRAEMDKGLPIGRWALVVNWIRRRNYSRTEERIMS